MSLSISKSCFFFDFYILSFNLFAASFVEWTNTKYQTKRNLKINFFNPFSLFSWGFSRFRTLQNSFTNLTSFEPNAPFFFPSFSLSLSHNSNCFFLHSFPFMFYQLFFSCKFFLYPHFVFQLPFCVEGFFSFSMLSCRFGCLGSFKGSNGKMGLLDF